ncbi:hypothetical protein AVEN_218438-1 [Araneus ventricosus]|uniref:Uncharacterized protein n=1 Tax=Araneus ventricosus TaxID=182803 RepID=A0A4Y2QYF7_ARAVE|nr:hypothetical protein AVEN_218438-1 [Araneus ventricosus]
MIRIIHSFIPISIRFDICTISRATDIKTIVNLPPCVEKDLWSYSFNCGYDSTFQVADISNVSTAHSVPTVSPEEEIKRCEIGSSCRPRNWAISSNP